MNIEKFTKRPITIEAVRLGGMNLPEDIAVWCGGKVVYDGSVPSHIDITTLEGVMRADKGDWIIKGVEGEFYPCKPSVLEKSYAKGEAASPDKAGEVHHWKDLYEKAKIQLLYDSSRSEREAKLVEALEPLLYAIDELVPYLDNLTDYSSTMLEWKPNRLLKEIPEKLATVRAALAEADKAPEIVPEHPVGDEGDPVASQSFEERRVNALVRLGEKEQGIRHVKPKKENT